MHIYFSGIGGTAIGPLALIAKQAGYEVSGSDKQDSQYIGYLRKQGITDITIDQSRAAIQAVHEKKPIDWLVYTSALTLENPDAPELAYATEMGIRTSKRDELLNQIIQEKGLKLIAVAGTHGKTTTTAMVIWLFKQLGLPVSYSVGAKISYGEMGEFDPASEWFVYEADEFDRNFLAFEPHISLITGVSWDHHEIFPTREDYKEAFLAFMNNSQQVVLWQEDADYLNFAPDNQDVVLRTGAHEHGEDMIGLKGRFNRRDARLGIEALTLVTGKDFAELVRLMGLFPGLQRRMEQIAPNLFTDYAHTPEKIRGAMSVALEMAADGKQEVIVVYEPLTNRRQHFMMDEYDDCFAGAAHIYWTPSYLAREDPNQRVIPPAEMISHLASPELAEPAELNDELKDKISLHLKRGNMVVGMAGGGGGSLDEWLRKEFTS
jgi:UDP-N-acetylmuramate--alanine ligase